MLHLGVEKAVNEKMIFEASESNSLYPLIPRFTVSSLSLQSLFTYLFAFSPSLFTPYFIPCHFLHPLFILPHFSPSKLL